MSRHATLTLAPETGVPPALLTPLDVSRWLGVSVRTVSRLPLPSIQIGVRKCRRYRQQDIERWLAEQVHR